MEVHEYFRLDTKKAKRIIYDTKSIVQKWQDIASTLNIPKNQQDMKKMPLELLLHYSTRYFFWYEKQPHFCDCLPEK